MKSNSLFACENVLLSPSRIFVVSTIELIALKIDVSKYKQFFACLYDRDLYEKSLASDDTMEIIDNELKERYIEGLNALVVELNEWQEDDPDSVMEKILLDGVDVLPFSKIFAFDRFAEDK